MGTRWEGVLAPINQPTGDGRRMAVGAFTHRPLPLPLRWQRPETQGHDDAVVVGSIDKIRIDDEAGNDWGEGELFDDVNPASSPQLAQDVDTAKFLLTKKVIGPSVDPGSASAVAVLSGTDDAVTDETIRKLMMAGATEMPPTETLFTAYEIAGATLVPVPAFAECRPFQLLAATDAPAALTAAATMERTAAVSLRMPPEELFADPKLDRLTLITRRELPNGWVHVFGHVAEHDTCLVGQRGVCTTPPYSGREYSTFHRYHDADGLVFPLPLGRLTAGFGTLENTCRCCPGNDDHACANISFGAAVAHHDRMQPLAYVRVGEDEQNNAIWFSGIEAPGVDERGQALLARQKISGDWREVAGDMELSEVLVLNRRNPGFPLPRATMRNGRARALTAAGVIRLPMDTQQPTVDTFTNVQPGGWVDSHMDGLDYDRLGAVIANQLMATAGTPTLEDVIDQIKENNLEEIREFEDGDADPEVDEDIDDDELVEDDEIEDGEDEDIVAIVASGVTSLPVAPDDHPWDKGAAVRRLVEWAGDDISGKYGRAFLWRDPDGDPDLQGSYKLPIADIIDGRLTVVPNAVRNAASRLGQVDGMDPDAMKRVRGVIDGLLGRIHGKGAVTAAAPEGGHTGSMLALRMTDEDAARLCVHDGLPMDQLHSTLAYLGEADKITPEVREQMIKDVTKLASKMQPFEAEVADLTVFNPGTNNDREPALVLGLTGGPLAQLHGDVSAMNWDGYEMPEQFSPYKPHITLRQPAGDLSRVESVADRMGPVTFDRLRLAFAGENIDIPLGGITKVGGGYDIAGAESMMGIDNELRARAALAQLELFGFNKNQRRGPDGKWIKMGGPGSAARGRGSDGGGAGAGGDGGGRSSDRQALDDARALLPRLKKEPGGKSAARRIQVRLEQYDEAVRDGDDERASDIADDMRRTAETHRAIWARQDAQAGGNAPSAPSATGGSPARSERDDYNKQIQDLGQRANGDVDSDDFDEELDNMLSDLDDAIVNGDNEKADELADEIADMIRNDWSVRGLVPAKP